MLRKKRMSTSIFKWMMNNMNIKKLQLCFLRNESSQTKVDLNTFSNERWIIWTLRRYNHVSYEINRLKRKSTYIPNNPRPHQSKRSGPVAKASHSLWRPLQIATRIFSDPEKKFEIWTLFFVLLMIIIFI